MRYGNTHKFDRKAPKNPYGEPLPHLWKAYVELGPCDYKNLKIEDLVEKVIFYLHESYGKNKTVRATAAPFAHESYAWGWFDLPAKVYFKKETGIKKPVQVEKELCFEGNGNFITFKVSIPKKFLIDKGFMEDEVEDSEMDDISEA